MASVPSLKLSYFDLAARAQPIRVALRMGGVSFEDERLSSEEFAALKDSLPYGQLPVLTVDGEVVAETQAILRYAARLSGLYPQNDAVAAVLVEEVLAATTEVFEAKIYPTLRIADADKRRRARESLVTFMLPKVLGQIEARLQHLSEYAYFENSKDRVFIHEVLLSSLVELLQSGRVDHIPTTIVDAYPCVVATREKVVAAIADEYRSPPLEQLEPVAKPAKLKLTYLNLTARGEFIRLALHYAGVQFENELITYTQINQRKRKLPYGQVPVLTIDGVMVGQSFALLRYAGSLSELYPVNDPLRQLKIDELISRVENVYYPFHDSFGQKTPDERRALREQLIADRVIEKAFAALEKRVVEWKNPMSRFIFGDEMTVADLAVYHIVDFVTSGEYDHIPTNLVDKFAVLLRISENVLEHPRVVDWYAMQAPK